MKDPSRTNSVMANALAQQEASHPNAPSAVNKDLSREVPVARKSRRIETSSKVSVPEATVLRTRQMSVNLDHEKLMQILRIHYPTITSDLTVTPLDTGGVNLKWEET